MPESQPTASSGETVERLARRLDGAWTNRRPIEPLSETDRIISPELAYPISRRWNELRMSRGDRLLGRKLGLTNRVIQERFGTTVPDHGYLWSSRYFVAHDGWARAAASTFIQPMIEGEIAFLIGNPLAGPGIAAGDVLQATEALAPALEIIDSRIADWRARLGDTIADNGSYGGFTLGSWDRGLLDSDLRTIGMTVDRGDELIIEGVGAATLGHPANAVAWLVNDLASTGEWLDPGAIVLSGSLGRPVPIQPGDVIVMELHGQPTLTLELLAGN